MIDVLWLSDQTGIFAFALTGALLAARLQLDIVASFIFAASTGLGGGVVRDLLMQTEVAAIARPGLLVPVLLAVLTVFFFDRFLEKIPKAILILDAFGLSVFAIVGTVKAMSLEFHPFSAVLLGTVTAVGGGVIRDTLSNRMPAIFRRDEIYAIPAFIGAIVTAAAIELNLFNVIVAVVTGLVIFLFRVVTIWVSVQSPKASLWPPSMRDRQPE